MECISKIEGINNTVPEEKKFGTLQPPSKKKPSESRTRSLSSAGEQSTSRKRTDTRPLNSRMSSCSDTGSFFDLLFSSDEDETRPCTQFTRSTSEPNGRRKTSVDFEKRKLNRGFPSGEKQGGPSRPRSRQKSFESDSSEAVQLISAPVRPSKRFLSLKRSVSKGSTGSNSSSSTNPSPVPRIEFERPNLFDQLRCEVNQESVSDAPRLPRKRSSLSNSSADRVHGRTTVSRARSPSHFKENEVSNATNFKEDGTRNTRINDRFEHRVQVHRENVRRNSSEQNTRYTPSKETSPSNAFLSMDRRMNPGRMKSGEDKKVSPSFTCLLTEDTNPKPVRRSNYQSPRKTNQGEDPLALHARNMKSSHVGVADKRSCPVEAPPRTVSASKSAMRTESPIKTYKKAHSETTAVETPRVIIPMTEAQKRYERRFSRSRSTSKSGDTSTDQEILLTPSYPPEILSGMGRYSLDMIRPTEETSTSPPSTQHPLLEGTVRPVLEDALCESHMEQLSLGTNLEAEIDNFKDVDVETANLDTELHLRDLSLDAALEINVTGVMLDAVIDADLDMDIENTLLELDEESAGSPDILSPVTYIPGLQHQAVFRRNSDV